MDRIYSQGHGARAPVVCRNEFLEKLDQFIIKTEASHFNFFTKQKRPLNFFKSLDYRVAGATGLEPATSGVTGRKWPFL